jgi:stalled ribosome rescue protein Dom34
MKLVHKSLEKDGVGSITLVPEETEDMWHAFNLIAEGDSVRASTIRKVRTMLIRPDLGGEDYSWSESAGFGVSNAWSGSEF